MSGAHAKQPPTRAMSHRDDCSVGGCERPYYARDLCRLHYGRVASNGTTEAVRASRSTPIAERLAMWSENDGECVIWTGYRDQDGYGNISVGGRSKRACRVAYEEFVGPIPKGHQVRHRCDNPPCIRPEHLEAGTAADNQRDKSERGRSTHGERNPSAKLSEADVLEIDAEIRSGLALKEIAVRYGVAPSTVGRIASRESWSRLLGGQRE